MKAVVWIISEGSPGHVSQSEGLAAAFAQRVDLEIRLIETRLKLGGFMRHLVRFWMGRSGKPLGTMCLRHCLACAPPVNERPDLIVTSGGKAVFAARTLAARSGAPLVFIGERKPYPSEWFHTVFTPSPFETGSRDVRVEMIPVSITPELVDAAAGKWGGRPDGELWAMLIGGSSASHRFTRADWLALGAAMNRLAVSNGIRWLVSTSRRTGGDAESALREALRPESIAAAVWWDHAPERKAAAFLGAARRVFVTQDSVTMVSEAVASGRPVVVVRPAVTVLSADGFLGGYFANLEARRRVFRVAIQQLADCAPASHVLEPRSTPIVDELAVILLQRLGPGFPARTE